MSDRWAVGNVRTGSELEPARSLKETGVEVYAPSVTVKSRPAGKRRPIDKHLPIVPGYLFIDPDVDPADVEHDSRFYYFLRDITDRLAEVSDDDLAPIRAIESEGHRPKYISGPQFHIGEIVKISYGNPLVPKAFWGYTGQIIAKRQSGYCLGGHDFVKEVWFTGCELLGKPLYSAA